MPQLRKPALLAGWHISRSTRLVMLIGCGYLALNLCQLLIQEFRLLNQGHILGHELATVRQKGLDLQGAIAHARTREGIERLARKNLGMVRPGEIAVRYVAPRTP